MARTTTHRHVRGGAAHRLAGAVAALGAVLILPACSSASASAPATVAASTIVHTAQTSAGEVLVDPAGRTLYVFTADTPGHSACTGDCLAHWPAEPAEPAGTVVSGATAVIGRMTRSDGTTQLTVNGYPAYLFAGYTAAGQAQGQGVSWWVISPSGTAATTAPSPSVTSSGRTGGRYS